MTTVRIITQGSLVDVSQTEYLARVGCCKRDLKSGESCNHFVFRHDGYRFTLTPLTAVDHEP